jgi:hypothetical protein
MASFAALREDSATSRDNEPYSANRKSASLHESRKITQFQCPTLSEKQLASFTALVLVSPLDAPEAAESF